MTERSECPYCGTPYVWKRKFNNGNPKDFLFSDCDCVTPEERESDARVEAMIARIRRQRLE